MPKLCQLGENDRASRHCGNSSENIWPVLWRPLSFSLVRLVRSEFTAVVGADAFGEPSADLHCRNVCQVRDLTVYASSLSADGAFLCVGTVPISSG